MKICILGPGSLGSTFGGLLTEAGFDVHMVGPWTEHMEAMKYRGLTIVEDSKERTVNVKVGSGCGEVGPVDLVIVLVKSSHTRDAIEGAAPLIGEGTIAISLQNGLGNEEIIAEHLGKERVLSGKTYVGGQLIAPGRVLVGRKGKLTQVGELEGGITERARHIGDLFMRAGLEITVSPEMRTLIWHKLLVNVSTGAISGITGLPYGKLVQIPEAVDCGIAAVKEAMAVARAAGIALSIKDPGEIFNTAVEGLPFDFKASILQDVERGVKTEIDFINGAVVRIGRKHGIPTPVNQALVAGIKGIEFGLGAT